MSYSSNLSSQMNTSDFQKNISFETYEEQYADEQEKKIFQWLDDQQIQMVKPNSQYSESNMATCTSLNIIPKLKHANSSDMYNDICAPLPNDIIQYKISIWYEISY
ncbi:hypothetical protein PPERSA_05589 [Pseudocohnilembus persalinus]|uniref:Uncharacterized protein n=1 Tax=Pseudocohnilembus persalinus TaxID=266149 RepID=A0A0V0Q7V9_PSEPJ|nr:hypothetical protein PPERSA_05589 [Pseudocohnilembus persalinus]|eukprot:KRW98245.1 hypothetical protein PPERSA_05589 [Pseudocohnilembus persalinus]